MGLTNKIIEKMIEELIPAIMVLLTEYFIRGGRDDEILPEAIQRAKMRAEIHLNNKKGEEGKGHE